MSSVVPQDVKDLSLRGEFNALTDPQIQQRITLAESCVNATVWGDREDNAVANAAAHFLVVDNRKQLTSGFGVAGPIKSVGGAGLSLSFGGSSSTSDTSKLNKDFWMQTSYGQTYWMLFSLLPLTPTAARIEEGEAIVESIEGIIVTDE